MNGVKIIEIIVVFYDLYGEDVHTAKHLNLNISSEVDNFHNNWQTQVCVPFTKIRL